MNVPPARVAVALCPGAGHDLEAVRDRVRAARPDVPVELVGDLGRGPELIRELAARAGAERLVLGLGAPTPATRQLRAWSRDAGLDPLAVEPVDLARFPPSPHSVEAAALVLAAAAAGLATLAPTRPEQLKLEPLSLDGRLSRQSLLSLPRPDYRPVAAVDADRCLGTRRCGLCLPACPEGAIEQRPSGLAVDRDRCASCGSCVTACPAGAIRLPHAPLERYEAELAVLLSTGRFGALLACREAAGGAVPLPPGWLPLELPCLGMVTPGWLLQALAAGAPAVAVLGCGAECRFGQASVLAQRVEYARTLLGLLGERRPAARLRTDPGPPPPPLPLGPRAAAPTLREPGATAEALAALAEGYGAARDVRLVHDASPLGLVELREETCAACGSCAAACPTGALAYEQGAEAVAVSFDGALCLACGRCVSACPDGEQTLRVTRATDSAALEAGRVPLKQDVLARCRRCGGAIAPAATLRRIRDLLEADDRLELVSELCPDCRALAAGAA